MLFTAILFAFGAGFSYLAEETGENAADSFISYFPDSDETLDSHAEWAGWTVKLSVGAALLAMIAVILKDKPRSFLLFQVLVVAAALASAYAVYETADHGGDMVYRQALKLSGSDHDHDAL